MMTLVTLAFQSNYQVMQPRPPCSEKFDAGAAFGPLDAAPSQVDQLLTGVYPSLPPDGGTVLVVDDDETVRALVAAALAGEGYSVSVASSGTQALERLRARTPDLVVCDVAMPEMDGLQVLRSVRGSATTSWLPFIFLTSRGATPDVVAGFDLGADDYLAKPFQIPELLARVRSKIERPPSPADSLSVDRKTGLVGTARFDAEVAREMGRAARGGAGGVLAFLSLAEIPGVSLRLGPRVEAELLREAGDLVAAGQHPLDLVGRARESAIALLLPETEAASAARRLRAVAEAVATHAFIVDGERLRVTPVIGFAAFHDAPSPEVLARRARLALDHAAVHLDLEPCRWTPAMVAPQLDRTSASRIRRVSRLLKVPLQVAATFVIGLVLPFFLYRSLAAADLDITPFVYLVVVVSLVATGVLIWAEGLAAARGPQPPDEPREPYPPATAVIAAYLPNEAATIVETVEAFLRLAYPAPLQVVLAYNTPTPMHVETVLHEIALRDHRFVPFRVEMSNSKAQNVNAALPLATGRFVGVFDADHHPDPDAFSRAWRWLSDGYDVVQGHCAVRNGHATVLSRVVAVEFEAIYALSHPGRAALHGFGIFGGSNGFWRTDRLHEIRMRGSMLTEDIDSSLRVIEAGGRIASDPRLVSRELATTTLSQLWNQRMRWAQGWFQVSLQHFWRALRSPHLSVRQKLGVAHLLAWREIYPWLSLQMYPILAFWATQAGGLARLDWAVPVYVLTTVFTFTVGPGQALLTYKQADPAVRRHRSWFVTYLAVSYFYTEYKNVIARVAQVKHAIGERDWRVTPRSGERPAGADVTARVP